MNIYIREALFGERKHDILIEGNRIAHIIPSEEFFPLPDDCQLLMADGMAVFPTFCNMHTHSAMSLFRGYGDDMPLEAWLSEKIWPNEANLDPEIVYWGSRLALLEMIKSGTTCFNDMYFFPDETARACEEMGMRATLSHTFFDHFSPDLARQVRSDLEDFGRRVGDSDLVHWGIAPHAVYTVSGDTLRWSKAFAREHGMRYHIHAAESPTECRNAQRDLGSTPVRFLNSLGVLDADTIVAHGLWLDDEEVQCLGAQGCTVVHNPNSNLKLASGYAFKYNELRNAGALCALGTDGCSSSNNLDMLEAAKTMSLLQKGWRLDPTALPADEALQVASEHGFRALGLQAGRIAEGWLADLMLVDLNHLAFTPNHSTLSNLLYAAHNDCIDTVICNGRILMQGRMVEGEEEIKTQARLMAQRLITH